MVTITNNKKKQDRESAQQTINKREQAERSMLEDDPIDERFRNLIEVIHFTENVSIKIHGLLNEADIYRTVINEFKQWGQYTVGILLLTDDGTKLKFAGTSIGTEKMKAAEKTTGIPTKKFEIDLNKSSIHSQVVRVGKTIEVNVDDILSGLFPQPLARLITNNVGYNKGRHSILTPLRRQGKIIGAFTISSPELAEHFIPTVKNFALHISSALELAAQDAKRKDADEMLRKSEKQYRALVENANEAILVAQDGIIKFANLKTVEMTGYSYEELISMPFVEFIHPDDVKIVAKNHQRRLKGDRLKHVYPFRIIDKNGNTKWVEINAVFISWEDKPATLNFLRDITDRKEAEAALQESREKLSSFVEAATDGFFLFDSELNYIDINKAAEKSFNLNRDKVIGNNISDVAYDFKNKKTFDIYRKVVETGEPIVIEDFLTHPDFGSKNVSVRAFKVGNDLGIITTDITERKQTEEALIQSEKRYRTILDDVEDGYYEVDIAGNFTFVNNSICRILGYSKDELVGLNYKSYMNKENAKLVYDTFNRTYRTVEPAKWFSWEVIRKNGESKLVESSIHILRNNAGEITGFRGIVSDVTEREKTKNQLLMTAKLASVGELAAGVAHELNNPLTGINGYAQLLSNKKGIPKDIKTDLDRIYYESKRAAKIVQNLLSFARQHKPEKVYIDINELIRKTVELRIYKLKASDINVRTKLAPNLPKTMADYHQMQQVILNILINAEQAIAETESRGSITIETSKDRDRDSISIAITDNGSGISNENIGKIFDPFFTTKEAGKGTGLGLSTCHGIVVEHEGNIYVQSKEGKGTTFVVKLPIIGKIPKVIKEKAVIKKKRPYMRKEAGRILIVNDEPSVCDVLSRVLAEEGYRTDIVSGAKVAMEKIAQNDYELFLIDLNMPQMSGNKLYETMKQKYPNSSNGVVFTTGHTTAQTARKFLDSTRRPYLTKPLDFGELIEVVDKTLGGRQ